jgi:hypothetical protein
LAIIAAAAGALTAPGSASAFGVCNIENAAQPTTGGGVITAPNVKVGNCPQQFIFHFGPQAESGGTWHTWNCSGAAACDWHFAPLECANSCSEQVQGVAWNPTGNPAGLDPNHLCAYRERIHVWVTTGSGNPIDDYSSGILPASC